MNHLCQFVSLTVFESAVLHPPPPPPPLPCSLVMQCGVKRKRCPSTEFDLEQQQTLFDTSVIKLHQEHLRHGMEPRLLRFVLINNALKLLQMHMLRLEEEDALGSLDYDGASNRFFSNTFKHGRPSPATLSPLVSPAKNLKLEQSQLMAATPFQAGEECVEEGEGGRPAVAGCAGEERRVGNGRATVNSLATVNQSCSGFHLGKHSGEVRDSPTPPPKKPCREPGRLNGASNGLTSAILDHLSLEPAPAAALDLIPSEDFAKVDTAMYDYDVPSGPTDTPPSSRPCTMQAIGTPVVRNGDPEHFSEGRAGSESPPDQAAESDFLDELDHIVNLLMT